MGALVIDFASRRRRAVQPLPLAPSLRGRDRELNTTLDQLVCLFLHNYGSFSVMSELIGELYRKCESGMIPKGDA